jgi:hypothetical protein
MFPCNKKTTYPALISNVCRSYVDMHLGLIQLSMLEIKPRANAF